MHPPTVLLRAYAAIFVSFLVVDGLWLTLVAVDLFKRDVGAILREKPDLMAAAAFYVIYPGGLLWLAVRPALEKRNLTAALVCAAVFGFTAYATFDLTNLSIIKGWTLQLALIDLVWGTTASIIAAGCGYFVGARASRSQAGAV